MHTSKTASMGHVLLSALLFHNSYNTPRSNFEIITTMGIMDQTQGTKFT